MAVIATTPPTTTTAPQTSAAGLTSAEVAERKAKGQVNDNKLGASRSYYDILRHNVFTFINTILFGLGIAMILLGRASDAFVTAGLVMINVVVGVVQEGRAKRMLDRIALVTRPHARVIRDGREQDIDPADIVLDDLLVAGPGDQIVVDGQLVGEGKISADESLLTGESDLVPKQHGDPVYSGSFCVTGSATYVAQKVGSDSLAHKITEGARAFRQIKTPLQRDVDYVVRMLAIVVTVLGVLMVVSRIVKPVSLLESVQTAAVIVSLVPQGLFFMITLTYALGAVRMAGRGALIQQANAIESMSNVTVLCLDKTGTLTSGEICLQELEPLGADKATLQQLLGDFTASVSASNRTNAAIAKAYSGHKRPLSDEVPFSSEWKWSAVSFADDSAQMVYVLGAPDMLRSSLAPGAELGDRLDEWSAHGLRVLLFASYPAGTSLRDANNKPKLAPNLQPLGLISFSDELRSEAEETIKGLAEAGVKVKIISGDNPETVAALAKQAGLPDGIKLISGLELDAMDDDKIEQVAEEYTIFGRITPQQKQRLVRALRHKGYYTAMIGDGVNDVLSLKTAQLGIAMQSGSQAARSVADMVLLNDSFAAVPQAFLEGQRIISGMQDVVRLLLTRTFYVAIIIIATAIMGLAFPLTPKSTTLQTLLTVGIPNLALAAWARPGQRTRGLLASVLHFVVPASVTVAVAALSVYLGYLATHHSIDYSRTILVAVTTLCGIMLLVFVEPPTEFWVGGDEMANDKRPTYLAAVMFVLFLVVSFVPPLRDIFELAPIDVVDLAIILAVVAVWTFVLRYIWRSNLMEKLFASPTSDEL